MKFAVIALGFAAAAAQGFEIKPCEDLKSEIAAKLDAKGVKNYQLDIVAAGDVKEQNVVGSCEGGTKKITYTKGEQASATAKTETAGKPSPAAQKK